MAVVVGTAQGKLTLDASKFITNIDSSYKALKKFNDLIADTQKALNNLPNKTIELSTKGLTGSKGLSFGTAFDASGFDVHGYDIDPNDSIGKTINNVNLLRDALNVGLTGALKGVGALAEITFSGFKKYTDFVVNFSKESLQYGQEFDATMSQVGAIAKADGEDLEALRNTAIDMGEKTKFSAQEAAQGMVYMGMAGWKTEQIIAGLPGVMNLAAASGEDLATTSDIVTDALTAFGLKAEDALHFSDVLAEASTDSNTNVALMGETFKYVAAMAGSMKYNIEDTAIAIGTMANAGIKGSQAGTALRNILTRLADPTDPTAAAMRRLGVGLTDQEGNAKDLITVMKDLRTAFADVSNAPEMEDYQMRLQGLNEQYEKGMYTEQEYEEELAGLSATYLKSIDSVKAGLASSLAGKFGLSGLLSIVNATDEEFQALTNQIYTSSTDLNLVTSAIQNSGVAWEQYLDKAQLSEKGMQTIAASIVHDLQDLGKSTDEVKERLQLQYNIDADDALKAIWSIQDAFDESSGAAEEMSEKMMDNLQGSITYFQSAMGTFKLRISDILKEPAKDFVNLGTNWVKSASQALKKEGIPGLIKEAGTIIPSLVKEVVKYIPQVIPPLVQGFWTCVNGVIDAIPDALPLVVDGAMTLFMGLVTGLSKASSKLLPMMPEIIDTLCDAIDNNADEFIEAAFTLFLNIITGIAKALPRIIKTVAKLIKKIISALKDHLGEIIEAGIEILLAIIEGLTDPETVKALVSAVFEIGNTIISTLKDFKWLEIADSIFSGLGAGLQGVIEGALGAVDEIFGTHFAEWAHAVGDFIGQLKEASFEFGKSLANSMHKTEIELNDLSTQYQQNYTDMLDYYAKMVQQGMNAQEAMAKAYQEYFNSAESQYVFRERFAKQFTGSGLGEQIGAVGMTNQQVVELLSRAQATTGNTYNFYSNEPIDERKAADEIRKVNEDILMGQ